MIAIWAFVSGTHAHAWVNIPKHDGGAGSLYAALCGNRLESRATIDRSLADTIGRRCSRCERQVIARHALVMRPAMLLHDDLALAWPDHAS